MDTKQPEALRLADALEYCDASVARQAINELRSQHARITELESQLAQRFDAADVATASAQGFWDGVASLTAQAADSVLEDAARLKEAVGLLEELAEHDSYSTEYDGRMISLCPECGEQEGEHRSNCAFVRAKTFLAARKQGGPA